jgi:hypothetical protein
MYSAGNAPSAGVHARCAALAGAAVTANSSYAPAGTSGSKIERVATAAHHLSRTRNLTLQV